MKPFPFGPKQNPDDDAWDETNCWTDFPYQQVDNEMQPVNSYGISHNMGGAYLCWRCGKKVERKNHNPSEYYPFCGEPCKNSADRKHEMKTRDYFKHGAQVRVEITNLPTGRNLIGTIAQGSPLNALIVLNEDLENLFARILAELEPLVDELAGDKLLLCDGGGKVGVWWEDSA